MCDARTQARGGERLRVPDYAAAFYMQERSNLNEVIQQYTTITITAEFAGAPDLISYRYYGTTDLYWFLCLYNDIVFIDEELIPGRAFKIPDHTQVTSYFSSLNVKRFDSRVGQTLSF